MRILTVTNDKLISISFLLIRLTLGAIMFVAGAGKMFGWFGGYGIEATLTAFAGMGFGITLTYLAVLSELIGGILLAFGLFTRPAAIFVMITMSVATYVLIPNGFFGSGGAAYPFTLAILALTILLSGPMSYSLDAIFGKKCCK